MAGARGLIGVFDARTGRRVGAFVNEPRGECAARASWHRNDSCYQATILGAAFAGRDLLVTGAAGGMVQFWDTQRRRPVRPPLRVPRELTGLDVSPDGSRVAVAFGFGGQEWGVEVVDVRSGRRVKRLSTPESEPYSVAFSPDGRLLAAGLANGIAVTWETDRWRRVGDPLVHRGTLPALDFSADGRTLATSSAEGTVALWDVASRDPIGSPLPRAPDRRPRPAYFDATGGFGTPRFTPDGSRLFVVHDNGHAVRWDLAPAVWRRRACAVAGGGLTRAEWEDAVPEQEYRQNLPLARDAQRRSVTVPATLPARTASLTRGLRASDRRAAAVKRSVTVGASVGGDASGALRDDLAAAERLDGHLPGRHALEPDGEAAAQDRAQASADDDRQLGGGGGTGGRAAGRRGHRGRRGTHRRARMPCRRTGPGRAAGRVREPDRERDPGRDRAGRRRPPPAARRP